MSIWENHSKQFQESVTDSIHRWSKKERSEKRRSWNIPFYYSFCEYLYISFCMILFYSDTFIHQNIISIAYDLKIKIVYLS